MTRRRLLAALAVASGLALTGCPDSGSSTPATVAPAPPGAPAPPPPPPREGWGAVGIGSSFETVTKAHFENGALPDSERTSVETVIGQDPDGARTHVTSSIGGVAEPEADRKYPYKNDEKDPDAKKPKTTHESVTVKAGTFECDVTTETVDGATVKTWRTKSLPVPVKTESRSPGLTATSELVKADVKK